MIVRLMDLLTNTVLAKDYWRGTIMDIADYLLENGVIVPPCKVGDVVWLIGNMRLYTKEEICSRKVISIQILQTGELLMHFKDGCFPEDAIGVYVFHSKKDAEKALKGGAE